ncbi:MAG: DegT/DnrJ/EryC1/StrS family aminotransferase [Candidatus Micrarchaeota archaeon]
MAGFKIGVGTADITETEKKYVMDALDNKRLSYGPYIQKFESEFSRLHSRKHGLMCNSGTSALRISVLALKEFYNWKDGDEIIVPALTFVATSNVVIQSNLSPVFVDVDPITYEIDPKLIEQKITSKTRAIIPVHLFGLPCDMDPIMEIARKHKLAIIEDSCETMFAKYKGKTVGSFGEFGCFSTYMAHLIVTGVGGLILCDNSELAVIARSMLNHGRDSIYMSIDDDDNVSKKDLTMIMDRRFSFVRLGYSFRATELEGAIGCAQLERWEKIISGRKENAAYLIKGLSQFSNKIQLPHAPAGREHVFMMFPIVVKDPKINRDDLTLFLEEKGIETRHMLPLINQPIYKKMFGDLEPKFPVASAINKNGFYIGCHHLLKKEELDYMIKVFGEYFERH